MKRKPIALLLILSMLLALSLTGCGKDTALTSSLVSVQTAISALTMPVLVGLAKVLG